MAGLPKKYAKMGFKKGWAAYKKSKKKPTTKRKSTKRKTATTKRRRSTVARRKRTTRRKKFTTVSIMDIGHMATQYANLTGQPLGTVVNELVNSLMAGNADPLEILMGQFQAGLTNITENPAGVAMRGAMVAFLFSQGKKIVGRKKIFQVGKFKITL